MPLVSVIIPTYNQGQYLGDAILSVLNQTYQDFEVIVVDDGSTDNTFDIVNSFSDPRVDYVYQENRGLSAARNTGIRCTNGPLMTFLDSDDIFLPEKLALLTQILENEHEIGLVAGKFVPIDEEGQELQREIHIYFPRNSAQLLLHNPIHVGSVLVRRTWIDNVGLFDETLFAYEDWDMWLRLARSGCRMKWIDNPVSLYRFHKAQMTRESERLHKASAAVLDKIFNDSALSHNWAQMRDEAYRNHAVRAAANAYRAGEYTLAKAHLIEAIKLDPALCAYRASLLARKISGWTNDPRTINPFTFLKNVYDNLPVDLETLNIERGFHIAQVATRLAFESYQRDDYRNVVSAAWNAFYYQPGMIFNRGLVSIFFRSCISYMKSLIVF